MSVPQWNADIITPDAPASDTPIATNGGLEKNQSGELGVSVDGSTVTINGDGQLEAAGGGETFSPLLKNDIVILPDGSYIGNYRDPDIDWYNTSASNIAYLQSLTTTSVGVLPYMRPWCYSKDGQDRFYTYLEGYSKTDVQDYIPVWIPGPGTGNSDCSCRLEYIGTSPRISNATRQFIDPTYPEKPAESISCVGVGVKPPPSASNVFDVDTTLWNKVGDWSTLTVPLDRWYFGMYNTTTQAWLAFDYSTNRVATNPFYQGGGPQWKVFVNIPAATSADAGKVLKIDSSGNPQWVTP